MSTAAAMIAPIIEPMPPSTTMTRMLIDAMKLKLPGTSSPWKPAYSAPAMPAKKADTANAKTL